MALCVHADFPGGNIQVDRIEGNTVYVRQAMRDTTKWWFYWCFALRGLVAGMRYTVRFTDGEVVGIAGPAYSPDGSGWAWLGADSAPDRTHFHYVHWGAGQEAYFCFCLPYQPRDLASFIARHAEGLRVDTLVRLPSGRDVPLLRIGPDSAAHHLLLTARHHACEATGNHVLEGILEYAIRSDGFLHRQCCLHVVPFVDLDGVIRGDQGKARAPHDHNRDYGPEPIYDSVRAIMALVTAPGRDWVFAIDLHSPNKWGPPRDDRQFLVSPRLGGEQVKRLGACLAAVHARHGLETDIPYDPAFDVAFGTEWWNREDLLTFGRFMSQDAGIPLCVTVETAYAGLPGRLHTQENMARSGRLLAMALELYWQKAHDGQAQ